MLFRLKQSLLKFQIYLTDTLTAAGYVHQWQMSHQQAPRLGQLRIRSLRRPFTLRQLSNNDQQGQATSNYHLLRHSISWYCLIVYWTSDHQKIVRPIEYTCIHITKWSSQSYYIRLLIWRLPISYIPFPITILQSCPRRPMIEKIINNHTVGQ